MQKFHDFEERVADIDSLYTRRHAHLVYGVVRWLQPRVVAEIGVYHGFMSAWIARGLEEVGQGGKLWLVDSWHDWRASQERVTANLDSLGVDRSTYECFTGNSFDFVNVRPGKVDLAVIDADHSYDWALADFGNTKMLGAWAWLFHDVQSCEGVGILVDEIRRDNRYQVVEVPFDLGYALVVERFERPRWSLGKDENGTPLPP